ncbi:MAG: hypothetical protein ACO3N7_11180 [Kiritimatiellia bacterium]
MKPKIIHTEEEYQAALGLVETLMDAGPGSPAEEELELWTLLIENYEEKHHPIPPPDRPLCLSMIRSLHDGLGIPTDVLVREPEAP